MPPGGIATKVMLMYCLENKIVGIGAQIHNSSVICIVEIVGSNQFVWRTDGQIYMVSWV